MEQSIEQKLRALHTLQSIHSKIDGIRRMRGELPIEVADLEDEVAGLTTRISKMRAEIDDLEDLVVTRRNTIKEAQLLIKKYETQQNNVKNNREYEALSKEIEMQTLEMQVCEKRIKEHQYEITVKTQTCEEASAILETRQANLEVKRAELDTIVAETQKEEEKLLSVAEKAEKNIENRLLHAYVRLRKSARNGLAVSSIDRNSCSGCFSSIPPQRQSEIRQRKKIIVCEQCGRIIVDEILAQESE